MRCFLAVPLAEPALAAAQLALDQLRQTLPGVRWTRPETLHITLHFFGWIDDARVRRALNVVRPVIAAATAFPLTLDRLGQFPDRGGPRVLWLGSEHENAAMTRLAGRVTEQLAGSGYEVVSRPFRAHCTLGRARQAWPAQARETWRAALHDGVEAMTFVADRVVLYESRTGRDGAVYIEVESLPMRSA